MRIGIPKEIKAGEYRVAMTPAGIMELTQAGHTVFVMNGAGAAVGFSDLMYQNAGAILLPTLEDVYYAANLIVKVKEPQPAEYPLLSPQHVLFTYLHLAADRRLTEALISSGATCIGYETVADAHGKLPLLAPMSEIAGRMAVQAGAHHLEMAAGGKGVLLGGIPGVPPARVLIIGGGVVGAQAATIALGMGALVTVMDKSLPRLRQLDELWRGRLICEYATRSRIEDLACEADLVIGSVLTAGAAAPKLLDASQVAQMVKGSVIVDVAIDQGGCFATSRPTTHENPTYVESGVIHYCVANIPSAVARTATLGLTNATLGYVSRLADMGLAALKVDKGFLSGLNIHAGAVMHAEVAAHFGLPFVNQALIVDSDTPARC